MKSTFIIAVTIAVLSSTATYYIVSNQSSSKDTDRERRGEAPLTLPQGIHQKDGTIRSEGLLPLQPTIPSSHLGSPSRSSHAKLTTTPPPPPHELQLQNSPDLIAQEEERKEQREKLRGELIQSMKENGLPEEHIRQMEKHLFADLPSLLSEPIGDIPEKTSAELTDDLIHSSVESNLPVEHQQKIQEQAEQIGRFSEEQRAKMENAPDLPPPPPSP